MDAVVRAWLDELSEEELRKLREFLMECLPDSLDSFLTVKSCMYTYSPDDDFYIDFLPEYDKKVAVACGFSGHGFKFAPVVGEILSDMALKGHSDEPIEFLSLNRV